MKVTVKRTHIQRGEPKNAMCCPIGLALQKKFGDVRVNEDNVEIRGLKFHLAADAQQFVQRFDKGQPVKPFSLEAQVERDWTEALRLKPLWECNR